MSLDPGRGEVEVRAGLDELRAAYAAAGHGVELVEIGLGWQFLTRPEHAAAIESAQFALRPRRLSPAALETLAIIAYRQPVGRVEVDEIRGVDAGAGVDKLIERGLGGGGARGGGVGRPPRRGAPPGRGRAPGSAPPPPRRCSGGPGGKRPGPGGRGGGWWGGPPPPPPHPH